MKKNKPVEKPTVEYSPVEEYKFASISRRALAFGVDVLLAVIIYSFVGIGLAYLINGQAGVDFIFATPELSLLFWVFLFAYFVLLESLRQGTLGKSICKIRVIHITKRNLTPWEALLRNFLRVIDAFPYLIPYGLGAVLIYSSEFRQRMGDAVAKSLVVVKEEISKEV